MVAQKQGHATRSNWLPWWVAVIVVLGAALTALGGVLALIDPTLLVGSHESMNRAAMVYAGYLVSRNLALALLLSVALLLRARRVLAGLMLLTILNQGLDLIVDSMSGRISIVPPILLLAVAFLVALWRVADGPLWKSATWQDRNLEPVEEPGANLQ